MSAATFAEQMQAELEKAILAKLRSGDWLTIDYGRRIHVDQELLREAHGKMNMPRVLALVAEGCEQRVADTILNAMATEVANDVKQILSNRELREDVRALIREKIRAAAKAVQS